MARKRIPAQHEIQKHTKENIKDTDSQEEFEIKIPRILELKGECKINCVRILFCCVLTIVLPQLLKIQMVSQSMLVG